MTLCVGVILAQFSANLENCLGDFKQKKAKMIRLKDIDSLESCTPISPEAGQAKPGGIVTPASFNAWKSYVFKIVKSTAEGCEPILTNALQLVEARYIKKARPNDVGAYHRYCHWVINIQSIEDDSREVSLAADENPDLVSCREAVANLDESEELDRRSDPLLPPLLLIQNLYIANYGSWYYEKHIEMDKKEIVELVMGGLANNADQLKESGFARMSRGSQGIRAAIDAVKSIHGLNGRERDKIPLAVGDEFVHYCGKIVKELEKVFRGEKCRNLDTDYVLSVLKALEGKRDDTFKLVEGAYAYLFCSLMTNNYESPDYLARRVREYFQDEDRYNAILLS